MVRMNMKRKKLSASIRRMRERTKLSFYFVIFFFGLFTLIVFLEGFSDPEKLMTEDDENVDDYYSISYDDNTAKDNSKTSEVAAANKVPLDLNYNEKSSSSNIQSDWQKVSGTKDKFYVYSAYYNSFYGSIRILAATKTKTIQKVQCRFYNNETMYFTTKGTIRTIRENWNLKYSAIFIICYLSEKTKIPRYVSVITASSSSPASNLIKIQFPDEKRKQDSVEFSVCVKPIHFNYDNILPFLEWMEFHRLMGVDHFTFFNHTIGSNVDCIMRQYEDVEVLPWSLPFISQKEIRTEGLFAALNDCVYRHRGASKYLALVDLDEMIVPQKLSNYSSLIRHLDSLSNGKKVAAYSFQNAFYYLQWPDDTYTYEINNNPFAEKIGKHLLMMRKTRRRARLHPHKQRSKYICDPEKVIESGNHFIWEMTAGYYTLSVPPHIATLNHYRICEFGGDTCTKSPFVKVPHRDEWKTLAIRVADQLINLSRKCHFNIDDILSNQAY